MRGRRRRRPAHPGTRSTRTRKPGIEGPGKARAKTGWDQRKVSGTKAQECKEARRTNVREHTSAGSERTSTHDKNAQEAGHPPQEQPRGTEEKKSARAGSKASPPKKKLTLTHTATVVPLITLSAPRKNPTPKPLDFQLHLERPTTWYTPAFNRHSRHRI